MKHLCSSDTALLYASGIFHSSRQQCNFELSQGSSNLQSSLFVICSICFLMITHMKNHRVCVRVDMYGFRILPLLHDSSPWSGEVSSVHLPLRECKHLFIGCHRKTQCRWNHPTLPIIKDNINGKRTSSTSSVFWGVGETLNKIPLIHRQCSNMQIKWDLIFLMQQLMICWLNTTLEFIYTIENIFYNFFSQI